MSGQQGKALAGGSSIAVTLSATRCDMPAMYHCCDCPAKGSCKEGAAQVSQRAGPPTPVKWDW